MHNLGLLGICSKNVRIINVLWRVRFRQCINLRFANIATLLRWQIRFHCVHPYNASNTKNCPPNLASYSIQEGKWFRCRLIRNSQFLILLCPKPNLSHSLKAVARLRWVNTSPLLAKQSVNVAFQSFVVNHSRNTQEMVRPNIFV